MPGDTPPEIVFLSPSYRQHVLERYVPVELRSVVAAKAIVVPNGVDPYWFRNAPPAAPTRSRGDPIRLLFVGSLTGNKNVESIARAAVSLRRTGLPVHLTVVEWGPRQAAIERFAQRFPDVVKHVGWVSAKHDLLGYQGRLTSWCEHRRMRRSDLSASRP